MRVELELERTRVEWERSWCAHASDDDDAAPGFLGFFLINFLINLI